MPPANTPRAPSPVADPTLDIVRTLTPLSYLSSPAPDLASTLVTQAQDDVHEENLRFLRAPPESNTRTGDGGSFADHPSTDSATTATQTDILNGRRHPSTRRRQDPNPGQTATHGRTAQSPTGRDPQLNRDRMMRVLARLSRFDQSGRPTGDGVQSEDDNARSESESAHTARPTTNVVQDRIMNYVRDTEGSLRREHIAARVRSFRAARDREDRQSLDGNTTEVVNDDTSRPDPVIAAAQEIPDSAPANASSITPSSSTILRDLQRAEREAQSLARRLEATQQRYDENDRNIRDARQRLDSYRNDDDNRSSTIIHGANNRSARIVAGSQENTSSGTTERMLRYVRQRESLLGSDQEESGHDSSLLSRWSRLARGPEVQEMQNTAIAFAEYRREAFEADQQRLRREILSQHPTQRRHTPNEIPKVAQPLESAVKYLDRLRERTCPDDTIVFESVDTTTDMPEKHDDVLKDLEGVFDLSASSFLRSGVKLIGSQHTSAVLPPSGGTPPEQAASDTNSVAGPSASRHALPSQTWAVPSSTTTTQSSRAHLSTSEYWPVEVVFHAVDLASRTMTATMQAHDVPRPVPGSSVPVKSTAPITTFVEGQIIDLIKHTFLTPSHAPVATPLNTSATRRELRQHFRNQIWSTSLTEAAQNNASGTWTPTINFPATSAVIDAANWRRLPPFDNIEDDREMALTLLNKERMKDISSRFIFMRWKERCFIHTKDDQCSHSPLSRHVESAPATTHEMPTSSTAHAQQPPLDPARYSSQDGFEQPIHRFPRPTGEDATALPATRAADISAANSTQTRLDAAPGPPRTLPGPGPNIVAHIAATTSAGQPAASRPHRLRHRPQAARPAATSTRSGAAAAPSVPTRAVENGVPALPRGEGDDTDTGHGLTISGFYYVSLNRMTGELVGLYWDPTTAPYQCLKLKPAAGTRAGVTGGWAFR